MARELNRIKRNFIFLQFLILSTVVLFYVFFISLNFVRKVAAARINDLNHTAELIVDQVNARGELPDRSVQGGYIVFVVDKQDGSLALPRTEWRPEDFEMWEQHRSKLIYEMQKKRHGWIFYPEKQIWDLSKQNRAIRYSTLDDLGWIVGVEVMMDSEMVLLKQLFNLNVFGKLLSVLFVGLFLIWLVTNWNFRMMQKMISESLESSLMGFDNAWNQSRKKRANQISFTNQEAAQKPKKKKKRKATPSVEVAGASQEPEANFTKNAQKVIEPQVVEEAEPNPIIQDEIGSKLNQSSESVLYEYADEEFEEIIDQEGDDETEKKNVSHLEMLDLKNKSKEDDKKPKDSKKKSTDLGGIKSSVLRNIINDMRDK